MVTQARLAKHKMRHPHNWQKDHQEWQNDLSQETKRKAVKFKLKILGYMTLILIVALLCSGCITKKGHKLGGGFTKGEDGVYRQPSPAQTVTPAPSVKSKPAIPIEPTYDPPNTEIIKKNTTPKPSPVITKPQPARELPPIKIEPKKEINLGLITIELPEDESEASPANTTGTNPDGVEATASTENVDGVKVHWGELFLFYLNSAVILCFIYVVYKVIRGEVQWKEPEINKHIKKLGTKKNVKRRNTKRTKKMSK